MDLLLKGYRQKDTQASGRLSLKGQKDKVMMLLTSQLFLQLQDLSFLQLVVSSQRSVLLPELKVRELQRQIKSRTCRPS